MILKYQSALVSPMVEAVISTRVVDSLRGDVPLPTGYGYSSAFSPLDYDNIRAKVGSFWDRFTDSAVRAGGWFGFVLIVFGLYKIILYVVTVIINFLHVRHDVGVLWAIPTCLFDVLCNLVFHGKIWNQNPKQEGCSRRLEYIHKMVNGTTRRSRFRAAAVGRSFWDTVWFNLIKLTAHPLTLLLGIFLVFFVFAEIVVIDTFQN